MVTFQTNVSSNVGKKYVYLYFVCKQLEKIMLMLPIVLYKNVFTDFSNIKPTLVAKSPNVFIYLFSEGGWGCGLEQAPLTSLRKAYNRLMKGGNFWNHTPGSEACGVQQESS